MLFCRCLLCVGCCSLYLWCVDGCCWICCCSLFGVVIRCLLLFVLRCCLLLFVVRCCGLVFGVVVNLVLSVVGVWCCLLLLVVC